MEKVRLAKENKSTKKWIRFLILGEKMDCIVRCSGRCILLLEKLAWTELERCSIDQVYVFSSTNCVSTKLQNNCRCTNTSIDAVY